MKELDLACRHRVALASHRSQRAADNGRLAGLPVVAEALDAGWGLIGRWP